VKEHLNHLENCSVPMSFKLEIMYYFSALNVNVIHEMTKVMNRIQSHKSYRKYKSENGRRRTSEYTRGGIRCHGGVSTPCRSITPAVSPFSRLGKRYEP
jgi:hypothetical protein